MVIPEIKQLELLGKAVLISVFEQKKPKNQ